MAQRKAKFTVADFSEGINTDSSPLNFPANASRDIKNFVIGDDGSLQRRLGLQALISNDLPSIAGGGSYLDIARSGKVNAAIWKSGSSFAPDYLVISYGGRVLEFYDMSDALEPERNSDYTTNLGVAQVSPVPVMTVFRNAIMASQAADYDTKDPGTIANINLGSTGKRNINLRTVYETINRGSPTSNVFVVFTVPAGVTIGSTSTDNPALRTGTWPAGARIELVNNGIIAGRGGRGGNATVNRSNRTVTDGQTGGNCIQVDSNIEYITNNNIIGAGGGGGGSAGSYVKGSFGLTYGTAASGGGGAGSAGGSPGSWSIKNISGGWFRSSSDVTDGSSGSRGKTESGGAGGRASKSRTGSTIRSRAGKGGDLGFKGADAPTNYSTAGSRSRSNGGDPGLAITGYSKVIDNNFDTNPPVGDSDFRFQS